MLLNLIKRLCFYLTQALIAIMIFSLVVQAEVSGVKEQSLLTQTIDQRQTVVSHYSIPMTQSTNDSPMTDNAATHSVYQGQRFVLVPVVAAPDPQTLIFSITNKPSWADFDENTGTLSGTPSNSDVGVYSNINIMVFDGIESYSIEDFSIVVIDVNDAPTISGVPFTSADEDQPFSFTPIANDVDGDNLVFSIENMPSWADFNTVTGELLGVPENDDVDTYTDIRISVSDGEFTVGLPSFDLTVLNVNDAPYIEFPFLHCPIFRVEAEDTLNFLPVSSDIDNDAASLSYTATGLPSWAYINPMTGEITATPLASDIGASISVSITVSDGELTSTLGPFDVLVVQGPSINACIPSSVYQDDLYNFTPIATDKDNDVLAFTSVNFPDWLSIDSATGEVFGTPDNDDVGLYENLTVEVTDGVDTNSLTPFSITVVNINDAPTISGIADSTLFQGDPYSFTPTANDVDVGDSLTFFIDNMPVWMNFDSNTGALFGTPDNDHVKVYSGIQISVSDGVVTQFMPAFTVTVLNVNDPPTISGTPADSVSQGSFYSFTAIGNDIDALVENGQVLEYSIINLPSWLDFDTATGQLSGTPNNSDVGEYQAIEIQVTDGELTAVLPPFDIRVDNVNDAPDITGTPDITVAQGESYLFTPSGNDIDNDAISFSILGKPDWLTFNPVIGALSGVPGNEDVGVHSGIQIQVSDGNLSTSLAVFDITVTNVNDPPTLTGIPSTHVLQGQQYSFVPDAEDIDGDTLSFSITNQPAWLEFSVITGALMGIPNNDDVGQYNGIQISVTDGEVTVDLASFDLVVEGVNDAPEISGIPDASVAQDDAYSFTPLANDIDQDSLVFSITNAPDWLSLDVDSGTISGIPENQDVGVYSGIVLTVSDGHLSASLTPFTITVTNVNDAPTITGSPASSVLQGQEYSFTPTANDIDDDVLFFSASNLPNWLNINPATGELSGIPKHSNVGIHSGIQITVSDGELNRSLPAFSIDVVNVNDAPEILGAPEGVISQDQSYNFIPSASDIDGDTLSFSLSNRPAWLQIDTATGRLFGTPSNDDVGEYTGLVLQVTDGELVSSLPAFDIRVLNVNDAPSIDGVPNNLVSQNESYSFVPSAIDIDGDTLSFTIVNKPVWLDFDSASGALSGVPQNEDVGVYENILISVTDGQLSDTLSGFSVKVTDVNDPPLISGSAPTQVNTGEEYNFSPNATDDNTGLLSFSINNKPNWLSFDEFTGRLSGTADKEDIGLHSGITISVSDGVLTSSLAPFNIEVTNVNEAPELHPETLTVLADSQLRFTPNASDPDGDDISIDVLQLPSVGSLFIEGDTWIYVAPPGEAREDSFILEAFDGQQTSEPALYEVNIQQAEVLVSNDIVVEAEAEDGIYTLDVLQNDAIGIEQDITLVASYSPFGLTSIEQDSVQLTLSGSERRFITVNYVVQSETGQYALAQAILVIESEE